MFEALFYSFTLPNGPGTGQFLAEEYPPASRSLVSSVVVEKASDRVFRPFSLSMGEGNFEKGSEELGLVDFDSEFLSVQSMTKPLGKVGIIAVGNGAFAFKNLRAMELFASRRLSRPPAS